jgi:hypothetical protein
MAIPVSKSGGLPQNDSDAALQRSARVALYLALSVVAIAGVYFAALYLVVR